MSLAARALFAFVLLPGVVAFLVPLWISSGGRHGTPFNRLGLALVVPGTVLLLWCVVEFYRRGRGTLAPWDAPRHLVVLGPYRVSRNPMYVAVLLVLWGWALGARSPGLAIYAAAVMIAFHLRVVLFEEPALAAQHGQRWTEYKARVPRWLGIQRSGRRAERRRAGMR